MVAESQGTCNRKNNDFPFRTSKPDMSFRLPRIKTAASFLEVRAFSSLTRARRSSGNYSCKIVGTEEFLNRGGLGEQSEETVPLNLIVFQGE